MKAGMFITFEGADGTGKTTLVGGLASRLRAAGTDVVATREPGGTVGADEIRRLLVSGATNRWSAMTELLLFNAARRDHVEKCILPAITSGKVVLCDRFVDSTRAYQAASMSGRQGSERVLIDRLHSDVIGVDPDLTIVLDADPEITAARVARQVADNGGTERRFEGLGLAFQKKLRDAYLAIAGDYPERCVVVDAARPSAAVLDDVAERLGAWMQTARRSSPALIVT